ncbi:TetR/AcrR family transcriptional regulator [Cellulosimicrobium arenosum]|uniref:TetR/AcrR family transcriptional regulator n=1 Tax=Cellulosimicrobium arenosum TaxID=2708133 RepID=A0A927G8V1_9MICO|nr:TetR/AcrR family transcriptional regulator [Cellulosimicrobium arenosum]MBD8079049.1 TetR/AcrR family transcriptional regulator [Cellulosimicrobium arenosum]
MTAPRSARALARETVTREILDAARVRLSTDGPGALSLRAVARDVGMVSSAVYRYFPSREALLTALLVACYDELGSAVERAEAAVPRDDLEGRWLAACRALRTWCVGRPGEFALLYGTPIPGYAAPRDTVEPATRVVRVLVGLAGDAWSRGATPVPGPPGAADAADLVVPARTYAAARGLVAPDAPTEGVVRTLAAWTALFGTVSFELFGHLEQTVADGPRWFDAVALRVGADLGVVAR